MLGGKVATLIFANVKFTCDTTMPHNELREGMVYQARRNWLTCDGNRPYTALGIMSASQVNFGFAIRSPTLI